MMGDNDLYPGSEQVPDNRTDRERLDELFRATQERLVVSMYALTGDLREAQDVVQEAFVRAVVHSRRVLAAESPEAWLRTVARNVARSRWRRHVRLGQLLGRSDRPPPSIPDISPDRVALYTAIRGLPARQREAIALHYLADLPVDEIADLLGTTAGTVKSRLHRARQTLSHRLRDDSTPALGLGATT
jgi:RNA polymerase sigma-70 factor (ECF subfamily)